MECTGADLLIVVLLSGSSKDTKDGSDGTIRSNIATNNQNAIGQATEGFANVYQQNGNIVVESQKGQQVQVYDVTGRRLYNAVSTGKDLFPVNSTGVYMVRIGSMKAKKIVMRGER